MVAGCAAPWQDAPAHDGAGVVWDEVESLDPEVEYELAGERYAQHNDFFAQVQTEIFDGSWLEGGSRSEIVPAMGGSSNRAPAGATHDNSYYFTVNRWYETFQGTTPLADQIAQAWKDRGWKVAVENLTQDMPQVRARTPEGYWFAFQQEPHHNRLKLSGHSPVFWGDYTALSRNIADRRNAQTAAGETWATTDRDARTALTNRQPGEYRPFPDWNILENDPSESPAIPNPWEESDATEDPK